MAYEIKSQREINLFEFSVHEDESTDSWDVKFSYRGADVQAGRLEIKGPDDSIPVKVLDAVIKAVYDKFPDLAMGDDELE